jgi:hypothetical protein
MEPISVLRDELSILERHWDQLTTIPNKPETLLHVLNYSLSSQGQGEVFMTRVLRYFLAPSKPHGMDEAFLRAFLAGLRAHQHSGACETAGQPFDEDLTDLSAVKVDRQVRLGVSSESTDANIEMTGPVDLVVESPGEWFLIIELKLGATENNLRNEGPSQTEVYYQADRIRETPKSAYEAGGYYLYLHKCGSRGANDHHFTNWTWESLAEDVLSDFIAENAVRFPQRTVVQLRDLQDDIKELTGMTDRQQNQQAKTELYLNHYEAIHDVTEAFDEQWGEFAETWVARFADRLENTDYGERVEMDDQLAGIDLERTDGPERWVLRAHNSDWAHLMKDGWWRRTDDLSTIYDRPSDRKDARVGFYHRFEANRDLAIGENTLKLTFRNMGANDDEFIAAFNEHFRERRDEIAGHLPERADLASIPDTRRNLIAATYEIRPEEHEDFFEAYLGALQRGFEAFVLNNEPLIELIDEAQESALDLYR